MLRSLAIVCLLGAPALASEEQLHPPKAVTLVADAGSFGEVHVMAKLGASGAIDTLAIQVNKATILATAAWLETLPPLVLAGMEIRSERGYGPEPVLYVVLDTDPAKLPKGAKRQRVHVWIEGGKLTGASITTTDAKGDSRWEQRKGPSGSMPGATQKRR